MSVHILDSTHPITAGVADFTYVDETYGNCEISPEVLPLLSTDHPGSMPLIGWVNLYGDHPIVFLQGGHGPSAFRDPNFQKILYQAIRWSTTKDN
jgi:type 1 glutamine amidotransferase